MDVGEIFKGMKIDNYYKYLLYLAGIIFALSLFFEVKNVDIDLVRKSSFWVIMGGLIIWLFQDIFDKFVKFVLIHFEEKVKNSQAEPKHYYNYAKIMVIFNFVFQIFVWIMILSKLK
jgi:hypothetical protein